MLLLIFLIIYWLLFMALGLWVALKACRKRLLPKEFIYIAALAASLTIYYFIFYIYLLSPSFASIVVKLISLVSLLALLDLCRLWRKSKPALAFMRNFFLVPLLITGAVMFAYSTVFFSCVARQPTKAGFGELDNRTLCHTKALPFDNSLNFIFGQNILKNDEKQTAATWNMVDRPPLQIAAVLPILDQGSHNSQLIKYFSYYVFSIFLELSWVAALWGIFKVLGLGTRFQILAFVALASTGFFYINSVFVWPKMLAASMVVTGILVLLGDNKKSKFKYLPFSGLLIALGALSHSGVLFIVVPFAIYYLLTLVHLKKNNLRYLGAALAIGILMLAPWYLYKSSVVNADRLTKWFFAGVTSADDKRGTAETIVDQYQTLSFHDWVYTREQNVKTLFTGNFASEPDCSLGVQGLIDKCLFNEWRSLTFFSTFFAFEFLALGWLAVIYQFVRRKIDLIDRELLLLIGTGLLFWVLAVFIPGQTIVHAGSYATMMFIALLLIKKLSELPNYLMGTIAVMQVVLFYLAWVTIYFQVTPL